MSEVATAEVGLEVGVAEVGVVVVHVGGASDDCGAFCSCSAASATLGAMCGR